MTSVAPAIVPTTTVFQSPPAPLTFSCHRSIESLCDVPVHMNDRLQPRVSVNSSAHLQAHAR
eukprot:14215-Heterococcus_DN1.PRE.1